MDVLSVRDLADKNKIMKKKHRVLRGKGQAMKKKTEIGLIYMHYRCIFVKDILIYWFVDEVI
ncbi:MAG: hypothetical protein J4F29_24115 [Candidatus Latescibacteria bacterium]|nr:hypothetical protein [Candidatus Latescibacterota bacterium]